MAGSLKQIGFTKATAITIDDSSDDEVTVLDSSKQNSFKKTPRAYSQVVSSSAKMPPKAPLSSDEWYQSPKTFPSLPVRKVAPAPYADKDRYSTENKKKVVPFHVETASSWTIDDASEDDVIVLDTLKQNAFKKTPCLHSQVVSPSAKMPTRFPSSSNEGHKSPITCSSVAVRTVASASDAENHHNGTVNRKKMVPFHVETTASPTVSRTPSRSPSHKAPSNTTIVNPYLNSLIEDRRSIMM